MANLSPFCPCSDLACPNHPANHSEGCTRCIIKNLELGEIPTCFFKKADPNYAGPGYFFKDFAKLVAEKEQEERKDS